MSDMCTAPLDVDRLLAYWLDEFDESAMEAAEQHLFECATCSDSLQELVTLATDVRTLLQQGKIAAVMPASFVKRLQAAGLKIREYRLEPHTSVYCTVTPSDDLVLAHLQAPLDHVERLDAIVEDTTSGTRTRLTNLSFNPAESAVVLLPRTDALRLIEQTTQHVHLIAVGADGERELGVYTFHHRTGGSTADIEG
ncbi:MAG TPA: hypothetical protein VIL28_16895 [Steroidobacteraceae bacterium]